MEIKKPTCVGFFIALSATGLLLHRVSSSRNCDRGRCSSIRCRDRGSSRSGSFSSFLAAGGQSEGQQGSNKRDTFHSSFFLGEFLVEIHKFAWVQMYPKSKAAHFSRYVRESQRFWNYLCYSPSFVADTAGWEDAHISRKRDFSARAFSGSCSARIPRGSSKWKRRT